MNKKSQKIFETAIKLFLKYGYSNTSMDEVAKESGVSKQTIYNNFLNKETILRKIIDKKSEKYYAILESTSVTKDNFDDLMEKFCRNFLNLVTDKKLIAIHRIVISEISTNPDITKTFFLKGPAKTYFVLEKFLEDAKNQDIINIESPEAYADHIISLLKGKFYLEMLFGTKDKISKEEYDSHLNSVLSIINLIKI